jgi:hypothetical protein
MSILGKSTRVHKITYITETSQTLYQKSAKNRPSPTTVSRAPADSRARLPFHVFPSATKKRQFAVLYVCLNCLGWVIVSRFKKHVVVKNVAEN